MKLYTLTQTLTFVGMMFLTPVLNAGIMMDDGVVRLWNYSESKQSNLYRGPEKQMNFAGQIAETDLKNDQVTLSSYQKTGGEKRVDTYLNVQVLVDKGNNQHGTPDYGFLNFNIDLGAASEKEIAPLFLENIQARSFPEKVQGRLDRLEIIRADSKTLMIRATGSYWSDEGEVLGEINIEMDAITK